MTTEVVQQDDVIYRLNKRFVREDAAIIQDVAASCGYDYDKSFQALSDLFGQSTSCLSGDVADPISLLDKNTNLGNLANFCDKTIEARATSEDQQTVPEMRLTNCNTADQKVPNGPLSQPMWVSNTGPKPNTGAIRKSNVNQKHRRPPKESVNKPVVEKIKRMLMERWLVLVILRGLPGSGKTYLSKELSEMAEENSFVYRICSADHHFHTPKGYVFNASELPVAHSASQQNAKKAFNEKTQLVIIDNTNIMEWEMKPYFIESVKFGYHIEILEPLTPWRDNIGQLRSKNVHNVPDRSLRNMQDKYKKYSAFELLQLFQLPRSGQKVLSLVAAPPPMLPPAVLDPIPNPTSEQQQTMNTQETKSGGVQILELNPTEEKIEVPEETCQPMSDDEEEIIDYEGVPESAREFYKNLPEVYPDFNAKVLRDLLRECHFDQEYFFDAVENSTRLLEKGTNISKKPLVTPIVKEVRAPTTSPLAEVPQMPKKSPAEPTPESLELKRALEEKFVIPKNQEPNVPHQPPIENETSLDDDDTESQTESSSSEEEEIEMTLDRNFAQSLLQNFGGPILLEDLDNDAFRLKVPNWVASKIHSCWLEAIEKHYGLIEVQLKAQLKNDAALARALAMDDQQPKETKDENPPNPSMDEILDEEKALQLVKNLQMKDGKNDLATKMSCQKLLEQFPNMDPVAIKDIFEAHNRDYNETVKVVKEVYMTNTKVKDVYTPEALQKREEELVEQAKRMSLQELEAAEKKKPLFVNVIPIRQRPNGETDEAKLINQIAAYRDEAKVAHSKKMKAMENMQDYLTKKLPSVAAHYNYEVEKFGNELNLANSKVSSLILENSSLEFLDLHYLYVAEALNTLDIFLDHHVQRRELDPTIGNEIVQVITGRGNRSPNGVAKIKPAIKTRLKKRGIQFEQINDGALRVYITRNLQYSSNYTAEAE
ncbi:NEDD4-binding protein 2 isoform X2 [Neocloeon triangulifer]|nr:NEDD4-binding protein 2 isoform X2 [Neocloeon triangulifer]